MKKFSKIFENKSFLGYSKSSIISDFSNKLNLNSSEIDVNLIYVYKTNVASEIITDEFNNKDVEDRIFSPMFVIKVYLGDIPNPSDFHEVNGDQSNNWSDESINFDLVYDEFTKLSNCLNEYKKTFLFLLKGVKLYMG